MRLGTSAVLATSILLAGCGGALGQATVSAKSGEQAKPIDAPLAVGASVRPEVRMELKGATVPLLLVSARPEVIGTDEGRLVAHAPGVAAILVTTREGVVIDLYHLSAERATRVALYRTDEQGKDWGEVLDGLDLLVGDSVYLTPKAYFNSQELGGSVRGEWSATAPIVDLLRQGVGSNRRLVGRSPGDATLRVLVSGIELKVPIRVLEAPGHRRPVGGVP
jgi:hypothetical protein